MRVELWRLRAWFTQPSKSAFWMCLDCGRRIDCPAALMWAKDAYFWVRMVGHNIRHH